MTHVLRFHPNIWLRLAGAVFGTLLVLSSLSGCAPTQPAPAEAAPAVEEPPPEPGEEETTEAVAPRPFPPDTLYELLVAEFAARRGAFELALRNYLQQARETRDPGVAARATRMARYLKAEDAELSAALLWAELDPTHPEARFSAATTLARAGRTREAFEQMTALRKIGGQTNFAAIAAGSLELPEAERRALISQLEALETDEGDTDILSAQAILLQSVDENPRALEKIQAVLAREPDDYQAVLIEAQIYRNLGEDDKAFERIEQALEANPDNKRLRLQYARMLASVDMSRAEAQFAILVERYPDDAELRLSLALVYRETERYDLMREQFEALIAAGEQVNAAHLYLGQDAERRQSPDEAIVHYLQITPSRFFLPAVTRAAELLAETRGTAALGEEMDALRKRYPEEKTRLLLLESEIRVDAGDLDGALAILDAALATEPGDPNLLYARSMVNEKRGNLAALERDLREMLRLDPDSALALNALGYSLTNLANRNEEALVLITRALELKPDDPAILDSMGWVHYRLGDPEKALGYLQDAFSRFPDHEVAAHLGEVLWVLGRHEEAREVWKQGLRNTPDSTIIREAIERLGVALDPGAPSAAP